MKYLCLPFSYLSISLSLSHLIKSLNQPNMRISGKEETTHHHQQPNTLEEEEEEEEEEEKEEKKT